MIFVDSIQYYPHSKYRYKYSCHMATDSDDLNELDAMALKLGLKLAWFQIAPYEHYNLTIYKREQAIKLGVIPVTNVELIRICIVDSARRFYHENKLRKEKDKSLQS